MGIKELADKAKNALSGARGKVGDVAEAAVDKVDDMTGGKVPDAVKNAVDKIDGETERDGGEGETEGGDESADTDV